MKRREIEFQSLDAAIAETKLLQKVGYERVGRWSLGQICNHLASAVDMMVEGKMKYLPRFVMRGMLFAGQLMTRIANRLRLRIPTTLPQKAPVDDAEGVARLEESIGKLRTSSMSHLRAFHLFHFSHHLSFLIPRES